MLASMQFDPRLIWDPVDDKTRNDAEKNKLAIGEQHV